MNLRPVSKCFAGSIPGFVSQRGVGLIEVLMAVLVLAIGLLGIALMQTRALAGNNSTSARSMAVVESYSILESMRADRANAVSNSYNRTMTGDSCTVSPTTTALATSQLVSWCTDLAAKLGATSSTTGLISCDAAGICTITITFDDSRIGDSQHGGNSAQTVITKAAL